MKFAAALALLHLVTAVPVEFSKRDLLGSIFENQLIDETPCRAVTILFVRGTAELGNVGTLTGPPFFEAVADRIGASNLAVQGVEYDASIAGSWFVAARQGAQVVHNTADLLGSQQSSRISSVVLFGDPFDGQPVGLIPADRALVICFTLDSICDGTSLILPAHLDYSRDVGLAADFVVANLGRW
ncbi:Putative cutinase/acetylxylan esterase, alpha/Beta hydrolase [Septoria linicola]|uniref:cutinase n=1 Tax=Septoria linicola TaxID=215465 RepID=A0A9Q9AGW0_9PEZI|nr:putative cutinase/acetylxylan esterase, alpha/Beta hydrolase [Septoria linicola]USW47394.1 Putative cutinase/acetylxylan esterase, alpha/Beta hydrolase [Septoria linicola]